MSRPFLKGLLTDVNQAHLSLSVADHYRGKRILEDHEKHRLLRQQRSKRYMEAVQRLDDGGPVMNQAAKEQIIADLQEELPGIALANEWIGIVSKCYLGDPYEVHTLAMDKQAIIKHYRGNESLPDGMEKARMLAVRGGYAFIEVYADCCRAIGKDGIVVELADAE